MAISRRDMLRAIGAVAAFVLTGEIGWNSLRNVDSQPAIAAPPKNDMAGKTSHQWAAVVDLRRCEGKGDCVRVCPENVFHVRQVDETDYRALSLLHRLKLRVHGMEVAYTPNANACRACSLCVSACPEQAITLRKVDTDR